MINRGNYGENLFEGEGAAEAFERTLGERISSPEMLPKWKRCLTENVTVAASIGRQLWKQKSQNRRELSWCERYLRASREEKARIFW